MKSLLQFLLLTALVVVGKQVKDQARVSVASSPQPVQRHVESMQSFFVQHVNYKQESATSASTADEYARKTNPVSLN